MKTPIILTASGLSAPKEVPLALSGLPAEINGLPVHYFKKEIARSGKWTHRGDGHEFEITPKRIDAWVENFKAREKNGVKTFVPGEHRATFNAADNHGFVIDLERNGESAVATLQLVGDKALELAAKNDVSIYVTEGSLDAHGNKYGEALEHLALTPNPNQPHLGPFVKIAASADTPARDVPVFEFSASTPAPSRKDSQMMTPELAKQFREKLGIAADVPDDKLPDLAATRAIALSGDVATLTTERDTLTQERDSKAAEVLALSADHKEPDALSLSLISKAFKTERDQVIASGVISPAGMEELDKLFYAAGKPNKVALSLSAGSTEPLYSRVLEILKKFPGIKTDNKLPADAKQAEPLRLSGDSEEKPELKRVNELRAMGQLPPLAALK